MIQNFGLTDEDIQKFISLKKKANKEQLRKMHLEINDELALRGY